MDVDGHLSPFDSSDDEYYSSADELVGTSHVSVSRTTAGSYAMRRSARVTASASSGDVNSQRKSHKSQGKARANAKPRATAERRKQTQAVSVTTTRTASVSGSASAAISNDPGAAQYAIHTAPPVRYQVAQGAYPARIPVLGPPMAADDEDEKLYVMTYNTEKGGTFLHCANMRTGTWDLMDNILSSNPFSSGRLLPPCPWTDMVFVKADNAKLLLIIGARLYSGTSPFGIEPDVLQILAVDVHTRTWSVLPTLGIGARQRYGHAAVVVDNTIYIFGGRRKLPEGNELWMCDPEDICESFCVLKLDETSGQWSWKVKDAPYPPHVKLGFLMGALVIDLGGGRKKILLVKGLMGESWENPCIQFLSL
ncbi:hypothetical protein VKT23_019676 [Stygiomarasmius scandens]|uniref:Kelch repeat-containing protein n=1 Tax=Marasmiellus scandens TaxID=2682957 RepID=A0ABR1IPQ9_9AGAR